MIWMGCSWAGARTRSHRRAWLCLRLFGRAARPIGAAGTVATRPQATSPHTPFSARRVLPIGRTRMAVSRRDVHGPARLRARAHRYARVSVGLAPSAARLRTAAQPSCTVLRRDVQSPDTGTTGAGAGDGTHAPRHDHPAAAPAGIAKLAISVAALAIRQVATGQCAGRNAMAESTGVGVWARAQRCPSVLTGRRHHSPPPLRAKRRRRPRRPPANRGRRCPRPLS